MNINDVINKIISEYYIESNPETKKDRKNELYNQANKKNIDFEEVVAQLTNRLDADNLMKLSSYSVGVYGKFLDKLMDRLQKELKDPAKDSKEKAKLVEVRNVLEKYTLAVKNLNLSKTSDVNSYETDMKRVEEEFNSIVAEIRKHQELAIRAGYLAGLKRASSNHDFEFNLYSDDELITGFFPAGPFPIDPKYFDYYETQAALKEEHDRNRAISDTPVEGEPASMAVYRQNKAIRNAEYLNECRYIEELIVRLKQLKNEYKALDAKMVDLKDGMEIPGYFEARADEIKMPKYTAPDKNQELKDIYTNLKADYDLMASKCKDMKFDDMSYDYLVGLSNLFDSVNKDDKFTTERNRAKAIPGVGKEADELHKKIENLYIMFYQMSDSAKAALGKKASAAASKAEVEKTIKKYEYILGEIDEVEFNKYKVTLTPEELEHKHQVERNNTTVINFYKSKLATEEARLEMLKDILDGKVEEPPALETDGKGAPTEEDEEEVKKGKKAKKMKSKESGSPEEEHELTEDEKKAKKMEELRDVLAKRRKKVEKKGKIHRALRAFGFLSGVVLAGAGIALAFAGPVAQALVVPLESLGLGGIITTAYLGSAAHHASKKK